MTIWTCSKAFPALGILVMLSACDTADPAGAFLAGFAPPSDAALPPVPLKKAAMMRGNVVLVPPNGYCIDPESLSQSFALMARCDTLGAATGGEGAPAGVLTVSITQNATDTALPSAQEIATAAKTAPPQQQRLSKNSLVFRTSGPPPSGELAPVHWRAVAHVGEYSLGAALYGIEGRRAVTVEGATLLEDMIRRTTDETTSG